MKFSHLHVHSHYSLLDGLTKIDELVAKAKEDGATSLALTDHGVMYGVIEFYQKCKKAGLKPIVGVETYLAPVSRLDKIIKADERNYHLVLLAKNCLAADISRIKAVGAIWLDKRQVSEIWSKCSGGNKWKPASGKELDRKEINDYMKNCFDKIYTDNYCKNT